MPRPRSATHVPNPAYPPSRYMPAVMTRLMTEDWDKMTAAANASASHVSRLDRWIAKARQTNPALDDGQVERLAVMLRRDHYRRMGRLSAEARRLAREAQAELDAAAGNGAA